MVFQLYCISFTIFKGWPTYFSLCHFNQHEGFDPFLSFTIQLSIKSRGQFVFCSRSMNFFAGHIHEFLIDLAISGWIHLCTIQFCWCVEVVFEIFLSLLGRQKPLFCSILFLLPISPQNFLNLVIFPWIIAYYSTIGHSLIHCLNLQAQMLEYGNYSHQLQKNLVNLVCIDQSVGDY